MNGFEYVRVDLLGRWTAPKTVRRLLTIPELPSAAPKEFEWPSTEAIATEQNEMRQINHERHTLIMKRRKMIMFYKYARVIQASLSTLLRQHMERCFCDDRIYIMSDKTLADNSNYVM